MKSGITFWIGQKDYFVQTDQKNRTIPFAIRVLKAIGMAPTNENAKALVGRMRKAYLEKIETESGFRCYSITGEGFGISAPVEDNSTVILALM